MTADEPSRALTLTDAWPLFGLHIRSARLVLRLPTDDELVGLIGVARSGVHAPDEMPFEVPWTDKASPAFEREFLQYHWTLRGAWAVDAWVLELGVFLDGAIIGAQTARGTRFSTFRTVDTGSWLARSVQGRGLGKEMRSAMLAFAFDGLEARFATSGAFADNDRSNGVSRSLGYELNGWDELAPRGVARAHVRYRMSAEALRAVPRPDVTVSGLEACREMFGA